MGSIEEKIEEKVPAEHQELAAALLAAVADLTEKDGALAKFCTRSTIFRFLTARGWKLDKATKMLRATLEWRQKMKPEEIRWVDVEFMAGTGRMERLQTVDKSGRPVLLMRLKAKQILASPEEQIKFLLYNLEASSRDADETGVGKMAWLLNMDGYTSRNSPPFSVSLETMSILQNHYPERLGLAIVTQAPAVFKMLWTAIGPFLDPVTKEKVIFIQNKSELSEKLGEHMDLDFVDKDQGGRRAEPYSLEEYSKQMEAEEAAWLLGQTSLQDKPAAAPSPDPKKGDESEPAVLQAEEGQPAALVAVPAG